MSADHKSQKSKTKGALDEMLDFGPEPAPQESQDTHQRLLELVKKLKEINERIDRLAAHF